MSNGNYETQILDTIQMLVDNAVSKANFDRTIQGTISRCVDATIGKYIVKYQNSSFYAYSYNTDIVYAAGTSVYVLVPENDMSKEKSIIGAVDKLGPDYVSIIEGENGYEVTGVNIINSDITFELCSYKEKDIKILYDKNNNIDLINLDVFGFNNYIKKSNSIICGATFKTSLPAEQQFRGDYGIAFNLDFMDNATGETITKTFIVNVDQMKGNPYNYSTKSRQYGIFDIDGENFIAVNQIYIFEYDFPNTEENKPNDIFISNFELSAANALDATEAATCALTFITPQGTYFDDNDLDSDIRTLQAQIRIKGNAIDNNSQLVKYYWFIENNNITNKSEKYNQYGGAGWECLNEANIIQAATENTDAIVQWVSGTYEYKTEKRKNVAKETNYKCVAVYSNDTVLSRTITIYNYSSDFAIEIKSDEGTAFYYDLGSPTLTCYVNGEEALSEDYEYVWSEINNANQFAVLNETTEENKEYNDAFDNYNNLMEQVKLEQVLTGQIQEDLDVYERILAQYENVMRVEGNKIHNLKISAITTFSTYKCSVYKNGIFIGTASIIITNSLQNENAYTLVINNGNQVFKYNEQGIAPTNPALENPVTILPLSFTLYDNKGQKVNYNAIGGKNVFWSVPSRNSLINISTIHGNPITSNENTDTYTEYEELNFDIDTQYDVKRDNNEIKLTINYKDKVLSAKTNFTFTKEGEAGTNGTDFICKIVPNNTKDSLAPLYPTVTYNEYNKTYSLNYTPVETEKWFKVKLWHNGVEIFRDYQSGMTDENAEATVQWSILKNNYGNNVEDSSNLSIDANTGAITFNPRFYENAANIVKCAISYKGITYYAVMPVIVAKVKNSDYTINLAERTGFRNVLYTADGQTPSYDSANPFEVIVTQNINGIKENISQLELSEFAINYDWDVCGATYFKEWKPEINLIEKTLFSSREKRNQKYYEPVDSYNGLCVNNAILCTINRGEEYIGSIHMPIHFYLNRYGNAAINDWDGNSISIDKDNSGMILAPQVGAGTKKIDENDTSNAFTGIFMGRVKEAGEKQEEHGLFGYYKGQRTLSLNAFNGTAEFGATGAGQIRIDPSTGEALLTSGNYDEEAGTGMIINLSEPSIKFGSGNFKVNSKGQVTAKGFTTGEEFEEAKKEIADEISRVEETIKPFIVEIDFPAISFLCNTNYYPINSSTFNVTYKGFYKNNEIDVNKLSIKMINDPIQGINVNIDKQGLISFSVNTQTQIPNDTNTFIFEISYIDEDLGVHLVETKSIFVGLNIQGKDGIKGDTGKSAYQLWLEAGNTGTEEDYLNSLKGETGQTGEAGKSAYQIWLDEGNIGTEEDYLSSLKGADGEDGKEGPQGPQGEPGKDGEKGDTGIGVSQIIEQYYLSTSNKDQIGGDWKTTQDPWTSGKYIWTRSEITWTDDSITYTTPILAEAINLANTNANSANTNANDAVNTANTAKSTAESASENADQAKAEAATATSTANEANKTATAASQEAEKVNQGLNSLTEVVNNNYNDLQNQIDGAISTWFDSYIPTLINKPASDWTTNELKNQHLGDLFYIVDNPTDEGKCYRFALVNGTYQWVLVADADVTKALKDAAAAQASADGKATIYTGTIFENGATSPISPQEGDLWMKSTDEGILTYINNEWIEYNKYTDDTLATEAKNIADAAKGESEKAIEDAATALKDAELAVNDVKNTVNKVDIEYYVSTSSTELVGGEWSTNAPSRQEGKYIWSRQKIYFVDETKEPQYSKAVCITGDKGATGATGNGIKSIVNKYAISESNTNAPEKTSPNWKDTPQNTNVTEKYLWNYEIITYTNNTTTETDARVIGTHGNTGENGSNGEDGRGIVSITEYFKISSSNTIAPTGDWFTTPETMDTLNKYLWSYEIIKYTEGPDTETDKRVIGVYGDTGDTGKSAYQIALEEGFEGTEAEWLQSLVGKDGEDGKDGAQGLQGPKGEDGKSSYLHIAYANNENGTLDFSITDSTNKLYIGQYVDENEQDSTLPSKYNWTLIKGKDGEDGEKGVGIVSAVEQYYLSTSETQLTGGSWGENQETWAPGKFIWTRTKITWTEGEPTYTEAILAKAINNANQTANNATNTAEKANTTANQAKEEAETATSTANGATTTANEALNKANSTATELNNFSTTINNNIKDLQNQIDGSISTWFYDYEPTNETYPTEEWINNNSQEQHIGDLFYIINNEEKSGQCYRYAFVDGVYKWIIVEDADVAKALADAAKAQDTADRKRQIFIEQPKGPYSTGDLWIRDGEQWSCKKDKGQTVNGAFSESDWEKLLIYTDDTTANEAKDLANTANNTANNASDTANNAHQEVQNTVNKVDVEYYLSESATELVGGSWATEAPKWVDGKYLWSRQKMSFVDTTKEPVYGEPACITGGKGEIGEPGKGITTTIVEYQISSENDEIPTGNWSQDIPTGVAAGMYIWTRTTVNYTEGDPSISYSISRIGVDGATGEAGKDGTSVTIVEQKITYVISNSGDNIPDDTANWIEEFPSTQPGDYIWSKTYIKYSNNSETKTYSVSYISKDGEKGDKGEDGKGISSTKIFYIASSDGINIPNTGWQEGQIPEVAEGSYLWTKTLTTYTDGTEISSYSVGRMGANGLPGEPGADGTSISISSTYVGYKIGDSGKNEPAGDWSITRPELTQGKYLWTYTRVIYSDGSQTESYSISYGGVDGAAGKDGENAKLISLSASSQVFKSNTGKNGTFYPEIITLTPTFQGVTSAEASWEYSLDGNTWVSATNANGISIDNTTKILTISKNSTLYTDDNSVITFKCKIGEITNTTVSISKIYDVVNMNIGARNYALRTATNTELEITTDPYYGGYYKLVNSLDTFKNQEITISAEFAPGEEDTLAGQIKFWGASYQTADDGTEDITTSSIESPIFYISELQPNIFSKKTFTILVSDALAAKKITHIGVQISGFTGHLTMQKLKVESGNVSTDWTMALEDLQNEEILEYALTNTESTSSLTDNDWQQYLINSTTQYLWQRRVTINNGERISVGNPICISRPVRALINTIYHYHESTSNESKDIPSILIAGEWSLTKPLWTAEKKGKYLWVTPQYFYSDGSNAFATSYLDTTWEEYGVLDQNLLNYQAEMENHLVSGYVSIKQDSIEVFDSLSGATSTRKILIDKNGIGYAFKDEDTGEWIPKSVWGIDGSFDAELLTVYNLTADEIKDGVLRLGKPDLTILGEYDSLAALKIAHPTGEIGDAYLIGGTDIYSWSETEQDWVLREGGYFELTDQDGIEIAKISQDGLEIKAKDGSRVNIFANNDNSENNNPEQYFGLCLRAAENGPIIAYTNTSAGTWNVKKQVIEESVTIGASIQIVPVGNGIGFVSIRS